MKLGLMLPNANNGFIMSTNAPQYKPSHDFLKGLVQRAEHYGFEFALSLAKWRGAGGPREYWEYTLESLTLIASLAPVTERIKLIGSVGVPSIHPAVVAKMASTIQDAADGRFMLNIVSGWNKSEYDQLGLWPGDEWYSRRYDYSTEYVQVLREFWETGESNFKGEFFQLNNARMKPVHDHPMPIVCTGASDRGLRFTAEHGEYAFIMIAEGGVQGATQQNERLLAAAEKAGREVKSVGTIMIVLGETDAEAEAKVQHFYDGADLEALEDWASQAQLDVSGTTAQKLTQLRGSTLHNNELAVGSPETVARKLNAFRDVPGLEGLMLMFEDYPRDLETFGQKVMPLLEGVATPVGTR